MTIEDLVRRVERVLAALPVIVLLRSVGTDESDYRHVARKLAAGVEPPRRLLVHGRPELAAELGVGLHLPAREIQTRGSVGCLISRAVHDVDELRQAKLAGATMVIAGTFYPTASKPGRQTLGRQGLATLCEQARMPIYAIGGINANNSVEARSAGAYGVAVCRGIMLAEDPIAAALELDLDER